MSQECSKCTKVSRCFRGTRAPRHHQDNSSCLGSRIAQSSLTSSSIEIGDVRQPTKAFGVELKSVTQSLDIQLPRTATLRGDREARAQPNKPSNTSEHRNHLPSSSPTSSLIAAADSKIISVSCFFPQLTTKETGRLHK